MVTTGYSYFLIVSCFMFLLVLIALFLTYRIITGKEKYKIKSKRIVKVINLLLICLLLIGSFFVVKSYLTDMFNYQPRQFTGTVVDIQDRLVSKFIYKNVLMDNKMTYYVFFNKFKLEEDKTYTITYLPNTKLILIVYEDE